MTRLFLASAIATVAVMHWVVGPDSSAPVLRPRAQLTLFGVEMASDAGVGARGPQGGAEWVETWEWTPGAELPFRPVRKLWVAKAGGERGSKNAELVRRGLGVGHLPQGAGVTPERLRVFAEAASEAQRAEAGLWGTRDLGVGGNRALAFESADPNGLRAGTIAGVALPMHHKEEHQTYSWELAEIVELGAEWVNLIVATRIENVDSNHVPLTSERTPSDHRIRETIALAHELGLRVQLMPIVLIASPGPKDWRGTLAPSNRDQFWRSYDRFVCHMADLASEASAEVFCIGSELASLEQDRDAWNLLIANVRMRYRGQLTYSANWDHFDKIPFWNLLDFASMTAYFTLCESAKEPATMEDLACVVEGWKAGLFEVWRLSHLSGLPAVFSEVGVPSATGALAGPWDYTLDTAVDVEAQRIAFEAFREVLLPHGQPAAGFDGAFLYDYWGRGGEQDKTYTVRGKPAAAEWRKILRDLAN